MGGGTLPHVPRPAPGPDQPRTCSPAYSAFRTCSGRENGRASTRARCGAAGLLAKARDQPSHADAHIGVEGVRGERLWLPPLHGAHRGAKQRRCEVLQVEEEGKGSEAKASGARVGSCRQGQPAPPPAGAAPATSLMAAVQPAGKSMSAGCSAASSEVKNVCPTLCTAAGRGTHGHCHLPSGWFAQWAAGEAGSFRASTRRPGACTLAAV